MENFRVDGASIEYEVHGSGEPLLLIHLSAIADGLARPLLAEPELASKYRIIHYHRRGYVGSTLGTQPLNIPEQAADAAALLKHLGVKTAHVAGHSFGGSIALQLAIASPDLVHSLALLEPTLQMASGGQERVNFRAIVDVYRSGDKRKAIELFSESVFGPGWQEVVERTVPGGVEQAVKDTDTVFRELPAIQAAQFDPAQASALRQPVLSVIGAKTSPFMKASRALVHSWCPQTEDFDPPTTHLLQMQDPKGVAHALAGFLGRHPIA